MEKLKHKKTMGLTFRQEVGENVKGASTGAITISPISLCITHKCKEHIKCESKSLRSPWEKIWMLEPSR